LVAKLLWLRRNRPEAFAGAPRVVHLPSFLASRLAGVDAIDANLAAMSGLFSLRRNAWWEEVLGPCGVGMGQLPPVTALGEVAAAGSRSAAPDFGRWESVALCGNDQTAGAVGNGASANRIVVTLGTALVVYRVAGQAPGPFGSAGAWGPYPGGTYYELATRDEGCLALDWAREKLLPDAPPAAFDELASQGAASIRAESPLFFPGAMRTPRAWSGADRPEVMAFSVLEGIAYSLRQLVEELGGREGEGTNFSVIGGGASSNVWMQLTADVLGCPVVRGCGDSLLGAASICLNCAAAEADGQRFQPRQGFRELLDQRYARWQQAGTGE
jgi:sugar (pentulose or hexulose) kinase